MKAYSRSTTGRGVVVRLDPGDDVLAALNAAIAAEGIMSGAVVSGIGTLRDCRLHMVTTTGYPAVETFPEWHDTALELTSMQGLILDGKPHIHVTVSTADAAVGGHLEPGCVVLYLGEVLIVELDADDLTRAPDPHGVPQIARRSS